MTGRYVLFLLAVGCVPAGAESKPRPSPTCSDELVTNVFVPRAREFDYPFRGSDRDHCPPGWWVCTEFQSSGSCVTDCQGTKTHLGEDWNYGWGDEDAGQPVLAVARGVVTHVHASEGWVAGVVVRHEAGRNRLFHWKESRKRRHANVVWSHYGHLDVRTGLKTGDRVKAGSSLGTISAELCATCSAPHLHLEIITACDADIPGPGYDTAKGEGAKRTDPSEFLGSVHVKHSDMVTE